MAWKAGKMVNLLLVRRLDSTLQSVAMYMQTSVGRSAVKRTPDAPKGAPSPCGQGASTLLTAAPSGCMHNDVFLKVFADKRFAYGIPDKLWVWLNI